MAFKDSDLSNLRYAIQQNKSNRIIDMRKYKYKVIYQNGNEETFIANGFTEAIVRAMNHAYDKAWDSRIKYITDERGESIKDIQFPEFSYSK